MEIKAYMLIGLVEALLLCLIALVAVTIYARRLKRLLDKHKHRKNSDDAKKPLTDLAGDDTPKAAASYRGFIDKRIFELKNFHKKLAGGQDIALDLDPDVSAERKMAALRHAMLVAEREAAQSVPADWPMLIDRYQQLMRFFEDFPSPKAQAQIVGLQGRLSAIKAKVADLETFKSMYLDLEKSWQATKNQAQEHYSQIKTSIDAQSSADELHGMVDAYHESFSGVSDLIDSRKPMPVNLAAASKEIEALRRTAAEQGRLIEHLKSQINNAVDDNAKVDMIKGLEKQLNQHQRMVKEAETCIELIESELSNSYKEIQSLKEQLKDLPVLRAKVEELTEDLGVKDLMLGHLKLNRTGARDAGLENAVGVNGDEGPAAAVMHSSEENERAVEHLQQELADWKKRYADLESLYLDLSLGEN